MKKVLFLSCNIDFCLADLSKVAEGALLTFCLQLRACDARRYLLSFNYYSLRLKTLICSVLKLPMRTFKVASKLGFKGMICLI